MHLRHQIFIFATKTAYHIWSNGPVLITLLTLRHIRNIYLLNGARRIFVKVRTKIVT